MNELQNLKNNFNWSYSNVHPTLSQNLSYTAQLHSCQQQLANRCTSFSTHYQTISYYVCPQYASEWEAEGK